MKPHLTELELLEFFGVEPQLQWPDTPWEFNDCLYELSDSDLRLTFAVSPADHDVRVTLWAGNRCVYDFHGSFVHALHLRSEKGRDSVEVVLGDHNSLWVFVRPAISVTHTLHGYY